MYGYRTLTPEQKAEVLRYRQAMGRPLHRPPYWAESKGFFLISSAVYEHKPHFPSDEDRLALCEMILKEMREAGIRLNAWIVLPNHYHLLVESAALRNLGTPLGRIHGRSARQVNIRDEAPGRRVWYRFSDRLIRDQRHYYATINYIHYNPVKHDYARSPLAWTPSSVHWYLDRFGIEWLRDLWREYPLRDYGKGWDW